MWFGDGNDAVVRDALMRAAGWVVAVTALALALAVLGEVLRRAGRAARAVHLLERLTPGALQRMAAVVVPAVLMATGSAAAADTPTSVPNGVRSWLSPSSTTATATTATATTATTGPATPPPVVVTLQPTPPRADPAPPTSSRPPTTTSLRYVVKPGDCLWTIARRALPPSASNAAIDRTWRRIYAANRAAIGRNPHLIRPGLALELPPASSLHAPEDT